MVTVSYSYAVPYVEIGGVAAPALQVRIQAPGGQDAIDMDAYVDSGASESLFDGSVLRVIGLDLLTGPVKRYQSTFDTVMEARLHRVRVSHDQLGSFDLEVGFSTAPIRRNLLGRDFFNLVQIGFRERQLSLLVEPSP